MTTTVRTLARSVVVAALVAIGASFITGPRRGLPFTPSIAHACSESLSTPQLSITTLGDGNRYIAASVNYSCVPTNDYITTIFHQYPGGGVYPQGWYANPGGSGTNNQYKNFVTTGVKWEVWAEDQATGYRTASAYITTY